MRTYVGSLPPSERARPSVSQPTQQQLLHLWGSGDTVVAIRLLLPQEPFPKNGLPKNRWIGQNCQNCPAKSYPKSYPKAGNFSGVVPGKEKKEIGAAGAVGARGRPQGASGSFGGPHWRFNFYLKTMRERLETVYQISWLTSSERACS